MKLTKKMRKKGLAISAVSVMLLSACGSGSTEAKSDESEAASPIAEFFGEEIGVGFDIGNEDFAAQERKAQEAIASCMKEQGFDYTVVDNAAQMEVFSQELESYGTKEWSEKYGFGLTTMMFSQEQVGPELVGYSNVSEQQVQDMADNDPNQKALEAMSDNEREAYETALYGDFESIEFGESMSEEEIEAQFEAQAEDKNKQGCTEKAYSNQRSGAYSEFREEFSDELDALENDIDKNPTLVKKNEEIQACVKDKGLDFPGYNDAGFEELEKRFDTESIQEEIYGSFDDVAMEEFDSVTTIVVAEGFEEDSIEEEALSVNDLDKDITESIDPEEGFEEPELSEESKTKLAELQKQELELAKAVVDCDGVLKDVFDLYTEVYAEAEREFLEKNIDRANEIKEANQETAG